VEYYGDAVDDALFPLARQELRQPPPPLQQAVRQAAPPEHDEERDAFNAELERVAAEMAQVRAKRARPLCSCRAASFDACSRRSLFSAMQERLRKRMMAQQPAPPPPPPPILPPQPMMRSRLIDPPGDSIDAGGGWGNGQGELVGGALLDMGRDYNGQGLHWDPWSNVAAAPSPGVDVTPLHRDLGGPHAALAPPLPNFTHSPAALGGMGADAANGRPAGRTRTRGHRGSGKGGGDPRGGGGPVVQPAEQPDAIETLGGGGAALPANFQWRSALVDDVPELGSLQIDDRSPDFDLLSTLPADLVLNGPTDDSAAPLPFSSGLFSGGSGVWQVGGR
jgi:hypothetical protein